MDETVIGTVIATVISTGVATFVSVYLNRKREQERFDLQLQNILAYSIEYPYLENRLFADTWVPSLVDNDERYQRYENYCCLVFNFLSEVCEWKKYRQKMIEKYIDIKNWLRIHEKCWKNPSLAYENADVYGKRFSDLVKGYIA
jgi:antitoxin component HigA of HigAB toxin-antitoxin module